METFDNNVFYEKAFEELVLRVAKWRSQGIVVIALRPPTCEEVVDLESEISGYREEVVRRGLIEAGAIWYDCDQFGYDSYDNSHLEKQGATQFTQDLTDFIVNQL